MKFIYILILILYLILQVLATGCSTDPQATTPSRGVNLGTTTQTSGTKIMGMGSLL